MKGRHRATIEFGSIVYLYIIHSTDIVLFIVNLFNYGRISNNGRS